MRGDIRVESERIEASRFRARVGFQNPVAHELHGGAVGEISKFKFFVIVQNETAFLENMILLPHGDAVNPQVPSGLK